MRANERVCVVKRKPGCWGRAASCPKQPLQAPPLGWTGRRADRGSACPAAQHATAVQPRSLWHEQGVAAPLACRCRCAPAPPSCPAAAPPAPPPCRCPRPVRGCPQGRGGPGSGLHRQLATRRPPPPPPGPQLQSSPGPAQRILRQEGHARTQQAGVGCRAAARDDVRPRIALSRRGCFPGTLPELARPSGCPRASAHTAAANSPESSLPGCSSTQVAALPSVRAASAASPPRDWPLPLCAACSERATGLPAAALDSAVVGRRTGQDIRSGSAHGAWDTLAATAIPTNIARQRRFHTRRL